MALKNPAITKKLPFYLANLPVISERFLTVKDKFSHKKICEVSMANKYTIKRAIQLGLECEKPMKNMPIFERKRILNLIAEKIKSQKDLFAQTLCNEVGKPIKDSYGEVTRSIETFEIAAEECSRIYGKQVQYDTTEANEGYQGIEKRFPIGLVSMISPYNFPLNLVAHKIAPAIASGCPFILKPSSLTPITAMNLGNILSSVSLPLGAFSIVPCKSRDAESLITHDKIKMLSFTGSPQVGWELRHRAGRKKVVLELGGNAACVVDEETDIKDAVERVVFGAFYQSGQSCISVQKLFVHTSVYLEFRESLIEKIGTLFVGDPKDEKTFVGPLISIEHAKKCTEWINETLKNGATILTGGKQKDCILEPTLLENVKDNCKLSNEEVFGPICIMEKFIDFKEVISKINKSKYGLQAGVFTNDLNKVFYAYDNLEVGAVVINDVPSKRIDSMPYGGVKESGIGKEGVRNSIEDMTETKLLLTRNLGKL